MSKRRKPKRQRRPHQIVVKIPPQAPESRQPSQASRSRLGDTFTRSELRARIAEGQRRLALRKRQLAALARMEDGLSELEQVRREIEAAGEIG